MPKEKETNPKDALSISKVPFHAIPTIPMLEVGLAMMEGGRKYGTHNYRQAGVKMSVYYDAAIRHLAAWWEGQDLDPASGIHHVVKAIAGLLVVRDGMLMKNCIDDRPIQYPDGIDMGGLNDAAAKLITKYPDCVAPFTQQGSADIDADLCADIGADISVNAESPQFSVGDLVKIVPNEPIPRAYLEEIEGADYRGEIIEELDDIYTNTYIVRLSNGVDVNLYPEELTVMERRGN